MKITNTNKKHLECLVLAQSMETYWAYYFLSAGKLYADDCRKIASKFINSYQILYKEDPHILNKTKELIEKLKNKNYIDDFDELINRLMEWSKGNRDYPFENSVRSNIVISLIIHQLKEDFFREFEIGKIPLRKGLSSLEKDHSARVIRWQEHMPRTALKSDPDIVLQNACETSTIVVFGDIRKSQDLMTYAQEPQAFSEKIVQFFSTTRELIEKHAGFLDKFTGDGFIVYFNDAVCKTADLNYIECFLGFITDEISFAKPFFDEWEKSIRKRPITKIGLAIGADIGTVKFFDIKNHLVAVGDAIVWASRMVSSAETNDVLVNNLLFATLDAKPEVSFKEKVAETKAGERFLAHTIEISNTVDPV
jgi:class 3 adenylate cyclase